MHRPPHPSLFLPAPPEPEPQQLLAGVQLFLSSLGTTGVPLKTPLLLPDCSPHSLPAPLLSLALLKQTCRMQPLPPALYLFGAPEPWPFTHLVKEGRPPVLSPVFLWEAARGAQ